MVRRHPRSPLSYSFSSGFFAHIPHSLTICCRYDGIIPLSMFAYTAIALAHQSTQSHAKAA